MTAVVADIYEWPAKLPLGEKLKQLEESLLCPICSEFLSNPHSLNCGHSFCSICIRKHLDRKINLTTFEQCPCCKEKSHVGHLRCDRSLSTAVGKFMESRKLLLDAVSNVQQSESAITETASKSTTSSRNIFKPSKGVEPQITKQLVSKSFFKMSKQKAKAELENLCHGSTG